MLWVSDVMCFKVIKYQGTTVVWIQKWVNTSSELQYGGLITWREWMRTELENESEEITV